MIKICKLCNDANCTYDTEYDSEYSDIFPYLILCKTNNISYRQSYRLIFFNYLNHHCEIYHDISLKDSNSKREDLLINHQLYDLTDHQEENLIDFINGVLLFS